MAIKCISKLSLATLILLTACTTTLSSLNYAPTLQAPGLAPTATAFTTAQTIAEIPAALEPQSTATAENDPEPDTPFVWVDTATPAVIGLTSFSDGINPLTGLAVENPEMLNRRPVMIKVSNYPRGGRPHAGLSFADLVFEYYIGEQMNRFLAIYYGQDSPKVGPLRSGRLIDAQLASMYGGMLVYGGADPKVDTRIINVLHDRTFTHFSTPCPPICGQDTHSISGVFVDSGSVTSYAVSKGIDNTTPLLNGLIFDAHPPDGFEPAYRIGVEYSFRNRGEWHYDPLSGRYLRWIEKDDEYTMIPLVDRINGQQLAFSNVIILYVTYLEYAPTLHDAFVWDNVEGNRAYVFRDGSVQEGKWIVPDHEQPIQLYNSNGLPIALKPGNSWVIFLGQQSILQKPQDIQWEFQFDLP